MACRINQSSDFNKNKASTANSLRKGKIGYIHPSVDPTSNFQLPQFSSDSRKHRMGMKVGFAILLVLCVSWECAARESEIQINTSVPDILVNDPISKTEAVEKVGKAPDVCKLCEVFASEALNYLSQNKTQKDIIKALHKSCSNLPTFKQECETLVDYYAPLFFLEVSSVQPGDFCSKVNLCEEIVVIKNQLSENSCELCHNVIAEALIKLKDPDTQLEIMELLLKGCNAMENYKKKCKKLVFEYGPLILVNAEQFLEAKDICTTLHACSPSKAAATASM